MMIKLLLPMLVVAFNIRSQTIVSQDFEGPLSGWYNEGTVTGLQNGISPQAGSGMLSLSINQQLESPSFNLPTGNKGVSFWLNTYNPYNLFTFSIEVLLLQGGNPVLTLGTWTNVNTWSNFAVAIPSGYNGNNYSVRFHVLNYSNSYNSLRFYLDNINISTGIVTEIATIEHESSNVIKIYPNPNSGELNISIQNPDLNSNLEIYSSMGHLLLSEKLIATNQSFDISHLSRGVYFVKTKSEKTVHNSKLVKE